MQLPENTKKLSQPSNAKLNNELCFSKNIRRSISTGLFFEKYIFSTVRVDFNLS